MKPATFPKIPKPAPTSQPAMTPQAESHESETTQETPEPAPTFQLAMTPQTESHESETTSETSIGVSRGLSTGAGHKIVLYGPGGVGKSTLAALAETVVGELLFVDIEEGTRFLNVTRIDPTPTTWDTVRLVLHDTKLLERFGGVVIDSFTKIEELAIDWTLQNIRHEKGGPVNSIEGYGWGKGYMHVYETFLLLLSDLDALTRRGKHIIATCHDCTAEVPNPGGEDWIRYEPRLQSPKKGKASIRHRVKEWCDHMFYLGFDTFVDDDGKAKGSGTRTIYPTELPTHWAKSRTLSENIPYTGGDTTLWQLLFGKDTT